MGILCIVSVEEATGKTAVCAGLAVNLRSDGKKAGYLKPQADGETAGDIAFMKQVLGAVDETNAPDVTEGRDIVLVEGSLGKTPGDAVSLATYGVAKEMRAKVIVVEAYTGQPSPYIEVYKGFGESLLGVVLNKVPASCIKSARESTGADFGDAGVPVLAVIPESKALLAITVGELAEVVKGKILINPEKSGELVANYILGALVVGSGADYFGRKSGKAVIVHQDRPDMQLAALETPTVCLILSGSTQPPIYNVFQKAKSRGVPVIAAGAGIPEIVAGIEEALSRARLRQGEKLYGLAELLKRNLDIEAVVASAE